MIVYPLRNYFNTYQLINLRPRSSDVHVSILISIPTSISEPITYKIEDSSMASMAKLIAKSLLVTLLFIALPVLFLSPSSYTSAYAASAQHSAPLYEMRGLWIASVINIDWPSRAGLTPDQQKQEYIRMMDFAEQNNFNAVFVQVRPTGDSMYQSNYLPWSHWLSGEQTNPGYDTLPFLVEEAHKRGLEFHAWINPYRVAFNTNQWNLMSPSHPAKSNPSWTIRHGGKYYFDPGNPAVRGFVINATLEMVRHYDIDAVHMDDYFYPYPIPGEEFDDSDSYSTYGGSFKDKGDWRRNNVNLFVASLAKGIKNTKPYVKFGISPFGVWRNKDMDKTGSDTQAGQTNYDDLYADTRYWLQKRYIDYMLPQIYWEFGHSKADYKEISDWWSKEIGKAKGKTHLYIGHGAYRLQSSIGDGWRDSGELTRQIFYSRNSKNILGGVFFSISSLIEQPIIFQMEFKRNNYPYKALVPPMPWLKLKRPSTVSSLKVHNYAENAGSTVLQGQKIIINDDPDNSNKYYVLYRIEKGVEPKKKPVDILAIVHKTGAQTEYIDWTIDRFDYYIQSMNRNNILGKVQKAEQVIPFEIN